MDGCKGSVYQLLPLLLITMVSFWPNACCDTIIRSMDHFSPRLCVLSLFLSPPSDPPAAPRTPAQQAEAPPSPGSLSGGRAGEAQQVRVRSLTLHGCIDSSGPASRGGVRRRSAAVWSRGERKGKRRIEMQNANSWRVSRANIGPSKGPISF